MNGKWDLKTVDECATVVTDYVANGSFASLKSNVNTSESKDYAVLIRLVDYNRDFNGPFLYISESSYNFLKKTKLYGDEIIISNVGANAGTVFKCPKLSTNMSLGPNSIMVKFNGDNNYFYYLFKSKLGEGLIQSILSGSAQPKFNKTDFKKLKIPVPPLENQIKIGKLLSTIDNKISNNKKIIHLLEDISQTLFKHWFIDFEFPNEQGQPYKSNGGEMVESELGEIPKGWHIGILSDVVDFSNGYAFKSKELRDSTNEEYYHVFKMGLIKKGGGLNKGGTRSYIEKSKCSKLGKYILKKGDLLMCMTDMKSNVALLGHTALMDEDEKYILNQRVGLLRIKDNSLLDYPYLYILTNSSNFIYEIRKRANSGVQVNLSTKAIKNTKLVIPSQIIHLKFSEVAKPIYEKIFVLQKENEYLSKIRDTLLPKLLSGEIEIPDDLEVK